MRRGPVRLVALLAIACFVIAGAASPPRALAIFNGVDGSAEAPWAVAIDSKTGGCTGSIISRHHVLTAAHCLGANMRVSKNRKTWISVTGQVSAGYTDSTIGGVDLAMLTTSVDLSTLTSRPLPLAPTTGVESAMRTLGVTLFGWGDITDETSPKWKLATAKLPATVQKTRDSSYFLGNYCLTSILGRIGAQLCFAQFPSGNVSRVQHGDSGGPWVAWYGGYWVELAAVHGTYSNTATWSEIDGSSVAQARAWILGASRGEVLSPASGTILRDSATGNAWLVGSDLFRRSIPTGGDYNCFVAAGSAVVNTDRFAINTVPEMVGSNAICTPPPPPPPTTWGVHIEDDYFGGTWARTDPNDGTWYNGGTRPPNGAHWYPNGLGVAVDCARSAASYVVHYFDGHTETWNTWFHVTDGKWYPSAATQEVFVNLFYGLPAC
jgi:hypothetical protein